MSDIAEKLIDMRLSEQNEILRMISAKFAKSLSRVSDALPDLSDEQIKREMKFLICLVTLFITALNPTMALAQEQGQIKIIVDPS